MSQVISMVRGDDKAWVLTVALKSDGTVTDITNCSFVFSVKTNFGGSLVLQKSLTLSAPLIGEAELIIDSADTQSLPNEKSEYVFDIQVTKVTGKKETLLRGTFIVLPEVMELADEPLEES